MAREHAGLSQATAAKELGLSGRSKSTLSAWEAGTREPRPSMLSRMAALYGVPVDRFMRPAPTAFEQIDAWLAEGVRIGAARESEDWAAGEGTGPEVDGEPPAERGRRSA
jgi:transcriptional regulator with XRE-family HTH domain